MFLRQMKPKFKCVKSIVSKKHTLDVDYVHLSTPISAN